MEDTEETNVDGVALEEEFVDLNDGYQVIDIDDLQEHQVSSEEAEPLPGLSEEDRSCWAENLPDVSLSGYYSNAPLLTLSVNPADHKVVATGGMGDSFHILTFVNGHMTVVQTVEGLSETVNILSFSPDGSALAVGLLDGNIHIYDTTDYDTRKVTLEGPGSDLEWLRWHKSGRVIMAGFQDSTIWLWLLPQGSFISALVGHGGAVSCGEFVGDNKISCSAAVDGSLIVWDMKKMEPHFTLKANQKMFGTDELDLRGGHSNAIVSIASHISEPLIATGSEDNTVKLTNFHSNKLITTFNEFSDTVECLQWLPKESIKVLAMGSLDGSIIVVDVGASNKILGKFYHYELDVETMQQISEERAGVTKLAWLLPKADAGDIPSVRDSKLISTGLDGTVRVWDMQGGKCKVLGGHKAPIIDLSVSEVEENGRLVTIAYTCSEDKTIKAFKIRD